MKHSLSYVCFIATTSGHRPVSHKACSWMSTDCEKKVFVALEWKTTIWGTFPAHNKFSCKYETRYIRFGTHISLWAINTTWLSHKSKNIDFSIEHGLLKMPGGSEHGLLKYLVHFMWVMNNKIIYILSNMWHYLVFYFLIGLSLMSYARAHHYWSSRNNMT